MAWFIVVSATGAVVSITPEGDPPPTPGGSETLIHAPGSYEAGLTVYDPATQTFQPVADAFVVRQVMSLRVAVDFGPTRQNEKSVDVLAPWVVPGMRWIVGRDGLSLNVQNPSAFEAILSGVTADVTQMDPGVGFTLTAFASEAVKGTYFFNVTGLLP